MNEEEAVCLLKVHPHPCFNLFALVASGIRTRIVRVEFKAADKLYHNQGPKKRDGLCN